MKDLIGCRTTYASMAGGSQDSKLIINADHIAYAEYRPRHKMNVDAREIEIEQRLEIHFSGSPSITLIDASADAVWDELKSNLPEYMKLPLEDED